MNPTPLHLPKILITGANGQLGFELTRTLAPLGDVVALVRAQLDLSDAQEITAVLNEYQPDIIVNPAAYTAVDRAESDSEAAFAINATAPKILAQWAAQHDALLVHYSTDYVFDGNKDIAYVENDAIAPQSVYGASKAQGEQNIREALTQHFIFRTSWVYGAYGDNFLKTMLKLMQTREQLKVVNDQMGAPTSACLLADVTAHVIRDAWSKKQNALTPDFGTYHLSAAGQASWFDYAKYIGLLGQQAGLSLTVLPHQIVGIPSSEYPTPAKRPKNSRLNTMLLQNTFGLNLPDWRDGVRRAFTLIQNNQRES